MDDLAIFSDFVVVFWTPLSLLFNFPFVVRPYLKRYHKGIQRKLMKRFCFPFFSRKQFRCSWKSSRFRCRWLCEQTKSLDGAEQGQRTSEVGRIVGLERRLNASSLRLWRVCVCVCDFGLFEAFVWHVWWFPSCNFVRSMENKRETIFELLRRACMKSARRLTIRQGCPLSPYLFYSTYVWHQRKDVNTKAARTHTWCPIFWSLLCRRYPGLWNLHTTYQHTHPRNPIGVPILQYGKPSWTSV